MKYWSYILFILFIVSCIFLLRNILKPSEENIIITGSGKCNECHILQSVGNQTTIWENSEHSNAYNTLLSDSSINFTKVNKLVEAPKNELCLRCHTTKYFMKGTEISENYNLNEGVGCEACHGAGSLYSSASNMKDRFLFLQTGGMMCDENICFKCHSPIPNTERQINENICPFQKSEFDYKLSLGKIKHPLNKDNF